MLKINSWLSVFVVLYGLAIMVYGVGGYVFPYFLADQWSLIIQAGIKATNDDAYRLAKVLADDACKYRLFVIIFGSTLACIGVVDNYRHGYLKKHSTLTA